MKSYLLINKHTGVLVEGIEVMFVNREAVSGFDYTLALLNIDGWIVTNPAKYFGGLWFFISGEQINNEWEIVGEV